MDPFLDLRHGLRALSRAPGSTASAVLCLAVGIGATTAIFSLVNGLFLRPMPGIHDPGRVVTVEGLGSYPNLRDAQEAAAAGPVAGLAGLLDSQVSLVVPGAAEGGAASEAVAVLGQLVSGSYFEVLGARPAAGRLLLPEDEAEARPVAVLGHRLWRERLGGDPDAVGRTLRVNGRPVTVVGVAPEGFLGTFVGIRFDLWLPLSTAPAFSPGFDAGDRALDRLETVARLAEGATAEQAEAAVQAVGRRLEEGFPVANRGLALTVEPLTGFDPEVRGPALGLVAILLAVALLIHVTACLNVANLLLARAAARRRELGIRVALGAGRSRVGRLVLVESLILAVAGGGAGLLLAVWGAELLQRLQPPVPFALAFDFSPDGRVLGFAVLVALASGLAAGLAPALGAARESRLPGLGEGGAGGSGSRLRSLLVVGQVVASTVLLVVAGLFLRTLGHAAGADPGFEPDGVEIAPLLDLRLVGPGGADAVALFRELEKRLEAAPGVESAGLSLRAPLTLRGGTAEIRVEGREPPPGEEGFEVGTDLATPGLFRTLRIPLLAGRGFSETDRDGAPRVAVVNRTLAERFWPGEDPLGRRIEMAGRSLLVVGVVGDVEYRRLGESPEPFVYTAHAQDGPEAAPRMDLFVRPLPGAPPAAPEVRRVLRELAPALPVPEVVPLRRFLGVGLLPQRVAGAVSGVLGAIGLGLAGVGLYGLQSFTVSQRVREIGIRMALGSSRRRVVRLVLGRALALTVTGVAAGGLLALAAAQALASLLFGVAPADPVTFAGVALVLLGTAVAGSWVPARRASRVDPMDALRRG